MLNEIITEIIDAENKAETIISEANKAAKDIGLQSQAKLENLRAQYAQSLKQDTKQIMAAASAEAEKLAAERGKAAEIKANHIAKAAEKNLQKTIEWLAEHITK